MTVSRGRWMKISGLLFATLIVACAAPPKGDLWYTNRNSRDVVETISLDQLDVTIVNVTRGRQVEIAANDYSTSLGPKEIWFIVNLDVYNPVDRSQTLRWKRWFQVQSANGETLQPDLSRVPVNAEISPLERLPVTLFFKLRDQDFPVILSDKNSQFELEYSR